MNHFMTRANYDRIKGKTHEGHCGFNFKKGGTLNDSIWILGYTGVPAIHPRNMCPCCKNVIKERNIDYIDGITGRWSFK